MNRSERGFTLVEIMIVVAIIALLAAIAIPNVLRGRTTANESAAIGNLRALISSLEMFRGVNNVYPDSWMADLYGASCAPGVAPAPDFGPPSFCNAANPMLVAYTVQGYNYTYTMGPGAPNVSTYDVLAVPQTTNSTGTRSFLADETGLIRHCLGGTGTVANMQDEATIDQAPNAC